MKSKRFWRWFVMVVVSLPLLYAAGRTVVQYQGGFYQGMRAPYLQLPAPDSMTLRWQTTTAEKGVVQYGLTPGQWLARVEESTVTEVHELRLTGLQPATRYYYVVGAPDQIRFGGDAQHYFETPPPAGSDVAVRLVVLGDPGEASTSTGSRAATQQWLKQHPRANRNDFDFLLVTGDLAYPSGSNPQFQQQFFTPYQSWLAQVPVWPVYGNHDARRFAFFKIFSLPTAAESGGVASGSEHFFSFDYGPVHIVVLDSEGSSLGESNEMYQWLQRDLAANKQSWLIAMFHHPPYTKGSHDSDHWRDSWGRLYAMRETFLPLLEQQGVDLVLSGHSHMYERSQLLRCHYGTSDSLQPEMIISRDPKGQYVKSSEPRAPFAGTIYSVVGSSARLDDGPLNHPAMAKSLHERGNLIIEINGSTLQGRFVNEQGRESDTFSLSKTDPQHNTPPAICKAHK